MMSFIYHLIFFCLLIELSSQFTLDPSKQFILDNDGRYAIFHGVNVVYKLPPYIPITDHFDPMNSLSAEDIVNMKNLGFNLVRLGTIWEAVERQAGVYDMEYLAKIKVIVNQLGENGIYTILDAHQDVFARNFCGEGVPPFYVEDIGYTKVCDSSIIARILGLVKVCKPLSNYHFRYDENGLPLVEDCKKTNFVEYHFSPEMTSAYLSFYQNKNGIQDKFAAFWQVLAREFKGNNYIVGYNIWNEPFPGGLWDNLQYLIPGKSDMEQLLPVYEKVDKAIREIDPSYILFFENMPFPDFLPLFGGLILGKFTKKPADDKYPQVYNVHNYCCLSGPTVCSSGSEPDLKTSQKRCPKYHKKKIDKNLKDAKELSVPLMITEFGACTDSEACYNEIKGVVKSSEERFVSWAYWMYKPYGDHTTSAIAMVDKEGIYNQDGTIQMVKEKSLSRGYIQYYQGKPVDFKFNDECTNFESSFVYNSAILKPTRLYFNRKFNYPNGYNIRLIRDDTKEEVKASFKEIDVNYIDIEEIASDYNKIALRIIFTEK